MTKTELLKSILNVVSEVCEISSEDILSHSKRNDIVDARCIFVHFCMEYGLPTVTIMHFLNRRRTCVINNYLQNYGIYSRQSFSFRLLCSQVSDKLSDMYPQSE